MQLYKQMLWSVMSLVKSPLGTQASGQHLRHWLLDDL